VDEKTVKALSNEDELARHLRGISTGLAAGDDWPARIAALVALQRLAWGFSKEHLSEADKVALLADSRWKSPLVDAAEFVRGLKDIHQQVT
jgi:hypothetical protein